ncbi:hypothetical protein F2Q70_00038646 [Brassica cretica]|uniref:Uncharacterized protein n=1 Tax=Brassica cretica TaxID=69181 RepID=A0A8S9K8Q3_BRACR|nr:hypothetical protein F2Q70_00038646 [Brassica cretica]
MKDIWRRGNEATRDFTGCMPNSTRSNKETPLLFSSNSASLERLIRKKRRSSSIDNNTSSSIDTHQPPLTHTPISSSDTRSPPPTEATLPSTDIFHPTSIDTSSRTSIDDKPRNMVATLVLVRDENGDLHDQENHLRNATAILGKEHMDEVKAKLDSVHKLLRKHSCLVEDADVVDAEDRVGVEEDVNFISGAGFQRSGNQNGIGNFYDNGQRTNSLPHLLSHLLTKFLHASLEQISHSSDHILIQLLGHLFPQNLVLPH